MSAKKRQEHTESDKLSNKPSSARLKKGGCSIMSVLSLYDESSEEKDESAESADHDLHADLRYWDPGEKSIPRSDWVWNTRPVLVRRVVRSTPFLPPETPPPRFQLQPQVDNTLQVYSGTSSLVVKTVEEMLRRPPSSFCSRNMYIDTCVAGQTKALKNWTKWKRRFCRQEIALCDKLGKTDGRLRFNTTSKLPILQDHKDESRGPESDFPQTTQRQRFFESDAFFKIAERPFEDDSLVTSLTWTERKLYKPPLTVVEHGLDTEGSPLTAENRAKVWVWFVNM
ncbi:hypothetical protein BaRGS_00024793 [Batillaria attramentaria]|uniref:Uncharacterized protein n=1 Tax=Batillaria attramentaria TaxID=370345 RepID=A0ABD0K9V2_9CAEN